MNQWSDEERELAAYLVKTARALNVKNPKGVTFKVIYQKPPRPRPEPDTTPVRTG